MWLRHYVGSDFEDIVPTLKDAPLENHVVNLLASGLAESRDGLSELLLSSFTGHVYWAQQMSRESFLVALDAALNTCLSGGVVRRDKEGHLAITDLGRACATKGLDVKTGVAFAEWAREANSATLSELEVLTIVSLAPAGHDVYINMTNEERFRCDYRGEILRRAHAAASEPTPRLRAPRRGPMFRGVRGREGAQEGAVPRRLDRGAEDQGHRASVPRVGRRSPPRGGGLFMARGGARCCGTGLRLARLPAP